MKLLRTISKLLMALLMVGAGTMHFVKPDFFLKIVPPYLPYHLEIVYVSGVCEILLGICLLIPATSTAAAWGVIVLLIVVFPANIYLFQHQEIVPASPTIHFLRLILQGVLIVWAYWHTRSDVPALRHANEVVMR